MKRNGDIKKVCVMGIDISVIDLDDLIPEIIALANSQKVALVNNANVHGMSTAWRNPCYAEILNCSDIVFCDRYGVKRRQFNDWGQACCCT